MFSILCLSVAAGGWMKSENDFFITASFEKSKTEN
jgi:hypothetical protein